MLAVQKWAEGKTFLFAIIAPQLATTARDIHLSFRETKERRILTHQFPLPHLPSWFALYRSHKKPLKFLRKLYEDFSNFDKESIEAGEAAIEEFRLIGRGKKLEIPALSLEDLEGIEAFKQKVLSQSFQDIKEEISPQVDPSLKAAMIKLLSEMSLEGSFFMLIAAPCWLLFRMSPTRLYRKARQGEFAALEKILSLDPLMIHDPIIGKQIQRFRFMHKTTRYEKLLETPLKESHASITSQEMKYAIGGFLSALGRIFKHKLSANDLHKLFDAVAKDFDGLLYDPDLPQNEDSFARHL